MLGHHLLCTNHVRLANAAQDSVAKSLVCERCVPVGQLHLACSLKAFLSKRPQPNVDIHSSRAQSVLNRTTHTPTSFRNVLRLNKEQCNVLRKVLAVAILGEFALQPQCELCKRARRFIKVATRRQFLNTNTT